MADFLTELQKFESGGRNVPNTHQGTSSGQAQGFNQITTGTWKEFGGDAYAPTPLEATQDQQNAIAYKIPMGRWAPETLAYLRNKGFTVDPKATLADNITNNKGTLGVTNPPHTATPGTTINATGTTPPAPPPTAGQLFAQGNIGGGFGALASDKGFQQDLKGMEDQLFPKAPEVQPMQAPNIQAHVPNTQAAQMMMANIINQGRQGANPVPQNLGGMGGMGGMNPMMMMQAGMNPYTGMMYG